MLYFKKTAIVVFSCMSSAVFAGTMGPTCVPGSLTIPCEASAWDIGVEALYLKADLDQDLNYVGYQYNETITGVDPEFFGSASEHHVARAFDWGWGFKAQGSYHFSTGKDFNLNWLHYSKSTDQRRTMVPYFDSGFISSDGIFINALNTINTKPQSDAVNLELGQHVDLGEVTNIRYHAGVQFARIKASYYQRAIGNMDFDQGIPGIRDAVADGSLTYRGFGPRVGADLNYNVGQHFTVYANAASELLVGSSKFSEWYNTHISPIGGTETNSFSLRSNGSTSHAIVPGLEAKLGIAYNHAMTSGDVSLNVGYMWMHYFNALHSEAIGRSDLSLDGLNLGLKWVG